MMEEASMAIHGVELPVGRRSETGTVPGAHLSWS
jgi:hypothetical protein